MTDISEMEPRALCPITCLISLCKFNRLCGLNITKIIGRRTSWSSLMKHENLYIFERSKTSRQPEVACCSRILFYGSKMNAGNMKPEEGTHRRRSARLSAPEEKPAVRKTFTVRKIVARKTQASEVNKENVERLSSVPDKRPKVSTPTPVEPPPPRPTILSPILPTRSVSPPPSTKEQSQDEVWSQKVRRSYSRLSGDSSFSSPRQQGSGSPVGSRRETLFGFAKMPTPKVMRSMSLPASAPQASSSLCGVTLNLSEVEDSLNHSQEPDPNIPGVAIPKKQSKKKRVQPIKMSELDDLAAKMNAEFAEAESFELVVE